MPFLDDSEAVGGLPTQLPTPEAPPEVSTGQALGAAFGSGNSIGQLGQAAFFATQQSDHTYDPDFDPYDHNYLKGYEDQYSSFVGVKNQTDADNMKAKIDFERSQDKVLSEAGGRGVLASLAAGLIDPVNFIPVGGEIEGAYKLGRLGRVAESAYNLGKVGLMSGVAGAAIAQGTRETETLQQSALNIASSTLFSAAVGGAVGAFAKNGAGAVDGLAGGKTLDEAAREFDQAAKSYGEGGGTAGAKAAYEVTPAQDTLAKANIIPDKLAEILPDSVQSKLNLSEALSFQDPVLRLANSESPEARRYVQDLAEVPLMFEKNREGIASPVAVERLIKMHEAGLTRLEPQVADLFSEYRYGRARQFGDIIKAGVGDLARQTGVGEAIVGATDKMSFTQFREAVGDAMRNNDKSDIRQVAKAAQMMRSQIFDPMKNEAIELGLLPVDVKVDTAPSYLSRLYNKQKIIAQRPEFEGRIKAWLKSTNTNITERFENHNKQADIAQSIIDQHTVKLDEAQKKLSELSPGYNEAKQKFDAADRDVQTLKSQHLKAETEATKARARVEAITEGGTDTPAKRAKLREAEYHAVRREKDLAAITDKVTERFRIAEAAKSEHNIARLKQKDLRLMIDDYRKIISINKSKHDTFKKLADDVMYIAGASDGELSDIARDITTGLVSSSPLRTNYAGVPVTRGPLKERTLGIPDSQIKDFLHNDIFRVARFYARTMGSDIELAKKFGNPAMDDVIGKITDSHLSKLADAKDEARRTAINKNLNNDLRDIQGIRDRLRGMYGLPDDVNALSSRAFKLVKNINFLRLLGGMTLSAIPDAGRFVMAHGLMRTFSDGVLPLVSSFKQYRMAADEVKLAGTALDMINNARTMSMAGLDDAYATTSKFERGIQAAVDNFGMISLMSPWNAAMKQFAGVLSQTRSLQAIESVMGGTIDKKEMTRLAQFGIDEPMAQRIGTEFQKNGKKDGGVYWANTQAWTDHEAVKTYQAALAKEVERIIVEPGQDKPLFMSRELGSVIMQFKSFNIASAQRVVISGLQERDLAQLNGAILSVGLGMLAYWAKTDHDKLSDDPVFWIKEGFDRGGMGAWMMDANNTVEKLSNNHVGISPALGIAQNTRYADRNNVGALLGPTFGLAEDARSVLADASHGDLKDSDIHKIRQMVPYQNVFYLRTLLDAFENGIRNKSLH